jgi:glycosyltransferase involved in cell wall biosynthesis
MPFFSVIIPAYNRANSIERAINSVLEQTYSNFEIIVVDDGSTDNTKNIVSAVNDSRVKYVYQYNKGVCAARNHGTCIALGTYFVFLDSDDYVENNWLEDFYNESSVDSPDLVFCNMKLVDLNKNTERIIKATDPYEKGNDTDDGMYLAGTFCVKATYYNLIGCLDENLKFGEFIEFRLRCIKTKNSKRFTGKLGLVYEASLDGGNTNLKNRIDSNLYVLEKHKDYFNKNKRDKKNYLNITAVAAIKTGNYKLGNKLFKESLFNSPNYKVFIQFIFSLSPFLGKYIWKESNNSIK